MIFVYSMIFKCIFLLQFSYSIFIIDFSSEEVAYFNDGGEKFLAVKIWNGCQVNKS